VPFTIAAILFIDVIAHNPRYPGVVPIRDGTVRGNPEAFVRTGSNHLVYAGCVRTVSRTGMARS